MTIQTRLRNLKERARLVSSLSVSQQRKDFIINLINQEIKALSWVVRSKNGSNMITYKGIESMEGEVWKFVNGFGRGYEVSNMGRFKSNYAGRAKLMMGTRTHTGYIEIVLRKKGVRTRFIGHRLIAEHFNVKGSGDCINHINGDKTDNRVENLEWCTRSENNIHAKNNHLSSRGLKKTYSYKEAAQMIALKSIGMSYKEIANVYGGKLRKISKICTRQIYLNVCVRDYNKYVYEENVGKIE